MEFETYLSSSADRPREETWLPGMILAVCAALIAAAVLPGASRVLNGDTWTIALAAFALGYGCLVGFSNQAEPLAHSVFWVPWTTFVLLAWGPGNWFFPWGWLVIAGLGVPIFFRLGLASHPFAAVSMALAIVGAMVAPAIYAMDYQGLVTAFVLAYGSVLGGELLGLVLRLTLAGRWQAMSAPPVTRLLPTRFSVMSVFAVMTALALVITAALLAKSSIDSIVWSVLASLAGGSVGVLWAQWYPNPTDGPGILHESPAPWVRCAICDHIERHRSAQCPKCGEAYPVAGQAPAMNRSELGTIRLDDEPPGTCDWTI